MHAASSESPLPALLLCQLTFDTVRMRLPSLFHAQLCTAFSPLLPSPPPWSRIATVCTPTA